MSAQGERRLWGVLLALLGTAVSPRVLDAQPVEVLPLFADDSIVELTLTIPLRTLVTRRSRRPEVTGTIGYDGPRGTPVTLDVEVRPRGHSRLELCSFPPLRLNLDREQVPGTLFEGQNRLKLVTLCRDTSSYADYLQLEYLIYRMYYSISEFAYNAKPVLMHYVDTERDGRVTTAPAFFIEDTDGLASRVGMMAVEVPEIEREALEPRALATLGLFQFMIGNTDWSVTSPARGEACCHNSDVLQDPNGQFVVVPYDFDQAGFINTSYALPNERLGIRSVRQRLYRGLCRTNEYLDDAIAEFNAARAGIESMIAGAPIDERSRKDAASYTTEFYEIINDPEKRQEDIIEECRGTV